MSIPCGPRLTGEELMASPGRFRVIMMAPAKQPTDFFCMGDHGEKYDALEQWRGLMRKGGKHNIQFVIHDDKGREVGVLGTLITEKERRAPHGKFRVVCVDLAKALNGKPTIWLKIDHDDRKQAIRHGTNADEGPYTGHQVHDDTGAALLPVR